MIIQVPIDIISVGAAVLWSLLMLCIGANIVWIGSQSKFEAIYTYIKHDEDDCWCHASMYDDMEHQKNLLEVENENMHRINDNLRQRCEAYVTQIECLKSEVCDLKKKKE